MDKESQKCVMVIAEGLPVGLAVNAAAVLAVTLGRRIESIVGPDVVDASGERHAGLINVTLPILKARQEVIKQIKVRAAQMDSLLIVDLTEPAQAARSYDDYVAEIAAVPAEQLAYLGIALYGGKGSINKLIGSLPLVR
jgi:hypothetical protein